jgi:serine/threonine protein phosphatase PrpC
MPIINRFLLIVATFLCLYTLHIQAMEGPVTRVRPEAEESTIAWGLSERQGIRLEMEDTYTYREIKLEPKEQNAYYFGIFDGHGGAQAADFAAEHAIDYFLAAYHANSTQPDTEERIKSAFISSYTNLDTEIQKQYDVAGTTALSALILGKDLYLAWAGDSRGVVIDAKGDVEKSTADHKPNSYWEKQRIIATGQTIKEIKTRLGPVVRVGALSVSRTLGDKLGKSEKYSKPNAIIATPEILKVEIEKGGSIILACDGLWDVMSNYEAGNYIETLKNDSIEDLKNNGIKCVEAREKQLSAGNNEKLIEIARILRDRAMIKKSEDNVSVMVIQSK